MSVRTATLTKRFATCAIVGLALFATSCSATPATISASGQTTEAASSSSSTSAGQGTAPASGDAAGDLADATEAFEDATADLSEEEAELFLQAFEEAFNADGGETLVDGTEIDPYAPASSVPANGGAPDHTAAIPYGLCADGWVVFDTITWSDVYAQFGHDPATYTGGVPKAAYDFDGYDLDAGASLIKDEVWCAVGGIADNTANLTVAMHPYGDGPDRATYDEATSYLAGRVQFLTTQAGQPMTIVIEQNDDVTNKVDMILDWAWEGGSDGRASLRIGYSNFVDGVSDEQVETMIALGETLSATVEFTPPAFTSPLPSWYTCEGRNFLNADVDDIAEIIGFDGDSFALEGIGRGWKEAECALAMTEADGDLALAAGDFYVQAKIFPTNSEEFDRDLENRLEDPTAVQGSATIAGREMLTSTTPTDAWVVLENESGKVVVGVGGTAGPSDADLLLAKALEVVAVITR